MLILRECLSYKVCFGLVLRHINHCWLINAKSIFINTSSYILKNPFSVKTRFSTVWPIDRTQQFLPLRPSVQLKWRVLYIPQSSCINEAAPSECFVSYLWHSLGESYLSAKMQSEYSVALAEGAISTRMSQKFCQILAIDIQFDHSGCFYWIRECGWTTLNCEMPTQPVTLWVLLILPDRQFSCSLSNISGKVWLLYCDQLMLHLSYNKRFWLLPWHYGPIGTRKKSSRTRTRCTFICTTFKSNKKWSNAQRVSIPTTTILSTIAGVYHGLNCLGFMICTSQTTTYKNI